MTLKTKKKQKSEETKEVLAPDPLQSDGIPGNSCNGHSLTRLLTGMTLKTKKKQKARKPRRQDLGSEETTPAPLVKGKTGAFTDLLWHRQRKEWWFLFFSGMVKERWLPRYPCHG
jgi:hypothetical protein